LLRSGSKGSHPDKWLRGWKPRLRVSDSVYFGLHRLSLTSSYRGISTDRTTLKFLFKARGRASGRTRVSLLVAVSVNTVSLQETREHPQQEEGQQE
jgi:hypothetical protein